MTTAIPDTGTMQMLIGGELRPARSGAALEAVNPATGELLALVPRASAEDVSDAVDAAQRAFPCWRATPPQERAERVLRLAQHLLDHGDELAMLDVRDNGSPIREMLGDISLAVSWIRHFAGMALHIRGETMQTGHDRVNYTLRAPYGVVGRIIPFNHPLMFATSKIAAPLIAGNTVVLKPSEDTSLSALALAGALRELFPPGVVNIVTGTGAEAGDALVTHPGVRRLAFIGSPGTGRAIQARAASAAVKAVTLELGGKNPLVVFPDANLDEAVDGAVRGMNFTWQGQSCGSTSRLLVHEGIHDEFVERLGARIAELRSGDPSDPDTDTGAIVSAKQHEKVTSYIALGRREGARLVCGGGPPEGEQFASGLFIRPTLFDRVRPDMRLAQEEIFGPVLAAIPFASYEEAVRIANGVRYGLTASVWTRDLACAHAFARDVEAGYVWVNDSSRHFLGTPFGGFKESGVGREEDHDELASYTQVKNVNVNFG
jgi:acyl-CoA reductase-like NAD-dependent aldehyde dehydrogenase